MQQFFIRKQSTQPILTMKVNKDNSVSYQKFNEMIENSSISFSMKNIDTGHYRIIDAEGGIILKEKLNSDNPDEYFVYYKFKDRDIRTPGIYLAEFKINFYNLPNNAFSTGSLIGPIHEELEVIIQESLLHTEEVYDSSTVVEALTNSGYTQSYNTVEQFTGITQSQIYYSTKPYSKPLFIDHELTEALRGFVKYEPTNTIYRFFDGYPVEII